MAPILIDLAAAGDVVAAGGEVVVGGAVLTGGAVVVGADEAGDAAVVGAGLAVVGGGVLGLAQPETRGTTIIISEMQMRQAIISNPFLFI